MSEPFLNEISQEQEGTEELSRAAQELNEITNEPESYIEGKIEVAQSEAIETSFNELVNNRVSGGEAELPALDGSSKPRSEPANELVENTPVPVPMPIEASEVDCDPIPLPMPFDEDVDSSTPEDPGAVSAPAAEDDWESPNVNVAINPDPIYRETGEGSIDPGPIVRETGEVASSPPEGPGADSTPASEDDWKPPLSNVGIDPRPIIHEAEDVKGAEESPMLTSQEPTPLLTDNEIIAIQKQLETNTEDFIIVSVLTESTGSTEKNVISNIK